MWTYLFKSNVNAAGPIQYMALEWDWIYLRLISTYESLFTLRTCYILRCFLFFGPGQTTIKTNAQFRQRRLWYRPISTRNGCPFAFCFVLRAQRCTMGEPFLYLRVCLHYRSETSKEDEHLRQNGREDGERELRRKTKHDWSVDGGYVCIRQRADEHSLSPCSFREREREKKKRGPLRTHTQHLVVKVGGEAGAKISRAADRLQYAHVFPFVSCWVLSFSIFSFTPKTK